MGRLQRWSNAFVSTGHGMLGVTLAPGSARALAQLVLTDREPSVLAPFTPARFHGGR
jgi:D-amino-acid dehydrogenase